MTQSIDNFATFLNFHRDEQSLVRIDQQDGGSLFGTIIAVGPRLLAVRTLNDSKVRVKLSSIKQCKLHEAREDWVERSLRSAADHHDSGPLVRVRTFGGLNLLGSVAEVALGRVTIVTEAGEAVTIELDAVSEVRG